MSRHPGGGLPLEAMGLLAHLRGIAQGEPIPYCPETLAAAVGRAVSWVERTVARLVREGQLTQDGDRLLVPAAPVAPAAPPPCRRWGKISAAVMRSETLSLAAKTVYAALATYVDVDGFAWVRQETLATDLNRSRAWVHAALAALEAEGIVQVERRYLGGRQIHSRYRIVDGVVRSRPATAAPPEVLVRKAAPAASVQPADDAVEPADTEQEGLNQKDSLSPRAGARVVEEGWKPDAAALAEAAERHPDRDIEEATRIFVNTCRAKGYRYVDHTAAWHAWLDRQRAWSRPRPLPAFTTRTTPFDRETPHDQRHRPAPQPSLAERSRATVEAVRARFMASRTDFGLG
jgi:hypothetical protein